MNLHEEISGNLTDKLCSLCLNDVSELLKKLSSDKDYLTRKRPIKGLTAVDPRRIVPLFCRHKNKDHSPGVLLKSIKDLGICEPLVITNFQTTSRFALLLSGYGRYRVARYLELKTVPVYWRYNVVDREPFGS